MADTFTFVVIGAIALFTLVGVVSWLAGGSVYDSIGQGGLTAGPGESSGMPPAPAPGSPEAQREREQEIRQMLQARSDRLVRNGGQPLDVDAELQRLTQASAVTLGDQSATAIGDRSAAAATSAQSASGKHDAALAEEVRQLVVARNERRERRGEPPLDVDAEVRRTLEELDA